MTEEWRGISREAKVFVAIHAELVAIRELLESRLAPPFATGGLTTEPTLGMFSEPGHTSTVVVDGVTVAEIARALPKHGFPAREAARTPPSRSQPDSGNTPAPASESDEDKGAEARTQPLDAPLSSDLPGYDLLVGAGIETLSEASVEALAGRLQDIKGIGPHTENEIVSYLASRGWFK